MKMQRPAAHPTPPIAQRGLTLIELMIGMVIGLILLLGVVNIFLAQRQAFRVTENLAHMQDNARTAFELMARDIREAGGNPCGTPLVANVVIGSGGSTWLDWGAGGVQGFDGAEAFAGVATGTATAERVAGTDAVVLRTASMNDALTIVDHEPASAQFKVNTTAHGIVDGDILMACDYRQAAIFQVTNASSSSATIVHNTGTETPGNCSKGLGYPTDCGSVTGNSYSFEDNGFLSRLTVAVWYVGNNSRGGRSLFRIVNGGTPQEVAEGVQDLQIQYLTRTGTNPAPNYVDATSVASWANDATALVAAVRVTLDLESLDRVGSDAATLKRELMHVVSLRHREIVE